MSDPHEPHKPSEPKSEDKGIFDVEPLPEPEPRPEPVPARAAPRPEPPPAKPAPKTAKPGLLGRLGGMLEDFDEDADFDRDPEVEAASGKKPVATIEAAPARPPFVKESTIVPGVWLGVGGLILVAAIVGAAVNEKNHPVAASFLTVYNAILHTCTGIAAIGLVTMLLRRPFGSIEQAGSRMFVAVTAFLLLTNTRITLIGNGSWEEFLLGSLAYVALVAVLFKLWRRLLLYVICAHFLFWMGVQIGMELSRWVASAPTT